jgi:Xaa-Pro aminopeptidase
MISDSREYRLPASFFEGNRRRFSRKLPERCVAILFAGKAVAMSADSHYRFVADRNFYYVSGIEQEESVILIRKNGEDAHSILFIHSNDPMLERWSGRRLSEKEAQERSGVEEVHMLPELSDYLQKALEDHSYSVAFDGECKYGPGEKFAKQAALSRETGQIVRIAPILNRQRMIKEPCEIEMIRKAIALTDIAIREALMILRPEVSELALQAALEYGMSKHGCLMPAFPTIVAAGENSFYLHHTEPSGKSICQGEFVLIDAGVSVAGLCSDITRVYPVGGSFSEKQSEIYQAVLQCQREAFRIIRPGIQVEEINQAVKKTAEKELRRLGIMSIAEESDADISSYVWHNSAHHLGMDVHDVHERNVPLEINCVLAVEPGIYVREWKTGFRIEDDVLVTEEGCEILSAFVAREQREIEAMIGVLRGD